MATHCFIPLRGKRIRVTRLDSCGNVPGSAEADAWIATNGFITMSLSSEIEDGAEIIRKLADGSMCVNEKYNDSFKRFTVEMEFCGVNPSLLDFMTNAEPYLDYAGDVAGFTIGEGEISKRFALELWTGLSGQPCEPGAEEASGYMLLPFVAAGIVGDIEVTGEDAITFSMTGASTRGGNAWGKGPYHVVYNAADAASFLPTALDPMTHLLMVDTALAPPPIGCDPQPMPVNGTTTTTTTVAATTTV